MNIVTTIYPNKAYSCIIHHNYVGQYNAHLYAVNGHEVKVFQTRHSCDGPPERLQLNRKDALQRLMEDIQVFYGSIGLIEPQTYNFVPNTVAFEFDIWVTRSVIGKYHVGWDKRDVIRNLEYTDACDKARALVAVCKAPLKP